MTREELLKLIESWTPRMDYFCDTGPNRGKLRLRFVSPMVTPDQFAELQKAIAELNEGGEPA